MTRNKNKAPVDTTWPPARVRDLKPDVPVSDKADQVRFPTLRGALERKTAQVTPGTLTEQLVQNLLRRTGGGH